MTLDDAKSTLHDALAALAMLDALAVYMAPEAVAVVRANLEALR
jgi:hypothetical protein